MMQYYFDRAAEIKRGPGRRTDKRQKRDLLSVLHMEYERAATARTEELLQAAFGLCGENKAGYMQMFRTYHHSTPQERQEAIAAALFIGARDEVRAIAYAAYRADDVDLLDYICTRDSDMQKALVALNNHEFSHGSKMSNARRAELYRIFTMKGE